MERQNTGRVEVPLSTLRDGESGVVSSITPCHGRGWGFEKRLMDLGITPGTKITVVKSAPFHGPVEVLVRGSRLALGRGMADRILVEVDRK